MRAGDIEAFLRSNPPTLSGKQLFLSLSYLVKIHTLLTLLLVWHFQCRVTTLPASAVRPRPVLGHTYARRPLCKSRE